MMLTAVALILAAGLVYVLWLNLKPDTVAAEPPPTEEELLQACLDLSRIERGIDLALAKEEAHQQGQRTKAAIAEALEGQQP